MNTGFVRLERQPEQTRYPEPKVINKEVRLVFNREETFEYFNILHSYTTERNFFDWIRFGKEHSQFNRQSQVTRRMQTWIMLAK